MNGRNTPCSKLSLLILVALLGVAPLTSAETVRLRPSGEVVISEPSKKLQSTNNQDALLNEVQNLRENGMAEKSQLIDLQEKLRLAYDALERESTKAEYRQKGLKGEIRLGEWKINPTLTLRENMERWRHQAEQTTKQDIPFIWDLPGPVELEVPAVFYGTWRDALWQLSEAFKTNKWDIGIEVAKLNNVVIFKSSIK